MFEQTVGYSQKTAVFSTPALRILGRIWEEETLKN